MYRARNKNKKGNMNALEHAMSSNYQFNNSSEGPPMTVVQDTNKQSMINNAKWFADNNQSVRSIVVDQSIVAKNRQM